MRKTNLNIKRVKIVKTLVVFLLVQIAIVLLFAYGFWETRQVAENEVAVITFVPDKVERIKGHRFGDGRIILYNGSQELSLSSRLISSDYSVGKMETELAGKELTVTYWRSQSIWGKPSAYVIDIRSNDEVYCSAEDYNRAQKAERNTIPILLVFVELVFLTALTSYLIFFAKEGKFNKLFKNKKN